MKINIGIKETDRKAIATGLSALLADSYTLYLTTHQFHWNVTGPMFDTLHKLFEVQYTELWIAVDLVAERIRILGFPAPGTYQAFSQLTSIKEVSGVPDAATMLKVLVEGNEAVVKTARALLDKVDQVQDESTLSLLAGRIEVHEKNAWMLRSLKD